MLSSFADMEAVLAAGEASAAGYDPYLKPNFFDAYERPHVYGPGWLITGAAGFTVAHLAEVSVLTVLGFLASLLYWYRPQNGRMAAWALLALLSSPVLLGIERANNDLIMVVLISLAAVLSRYKGAVFIFCVIILLASVAWLKLYPLVAGIALLTLPSDFRSVVNRLLLWGGLTVLGFGLYAHDYLRFLPNIPNADSVFDYSFRKALDITVRGIPGARLWIWSGVLLSGGMAIKILWRHRRDYWEALPLTGPWAFFIVSAAAIWVGCLLMNGNYPYRAVWLLPLLAWAGAANTGRPVACRALCQWILISLSLYWLQWQYFYELLPQWRIEGFSILGGMFFVIGLSQSAVVLMTVLIAWLLVGWAVRRVRSLFFCTARSSNRS